MDEYRARLCNSEYPARRKYKCADTNNTENNDGIKYNVLFKINWKPDTPFLLTCVISSYRSDGNVLQESAVGAIGSLFVRVPFSQQPFSCQRSFLQFLKLVLHLNHDHRGCKSNNRRLCLHVDNGSSISRSLNSDNPPEEHARFY